MSLVSRMREQRERDQETRPKSRNSNADFFKAEEGKTYLVAIVPPNGEYDALPDTAGVPWVRVLRYNQSYGATKSDRLPPMPCIAASQDNWVLDHPTIIDFLKEKDVDTSFDPLGDVMQRVDDDSADIYESIGSKVMETIRLQDDYLIPIYVVASWDSNGRRPSKIGDPETWSKCFWWAYSSHRDTIVECASAMPPIDEEDENSEPCSPLDTSAFTFFQIGKNKEGKKVSWAIVLDPPTLQRPYKWSENALAMLEEDQGEKGALNPFVHIARMTKDSNEILKGLRGTRTTRGAQPPASRNRRQEEPASRGRGRQVEEDEPPARGRRQVEEEPEAPPARTRTRQVEEKAEEPVRRRKTQEEDEPPARRKTQEEDEPPARRRKPEPEPEPEEPKARSKPKTEEPKAKDPDTHEVDEDDVDEFERAIARRAGK